MSINSVPASEHLTHSRKYMRLGLPIDRISHHCVANCAFSAGEISIRHSPSVCFSDLTASKMFLASRFASSRISLWVWRQRPGWRVPQGWHSRRAVVHCSCGKGAPSRFRHTSLGARPLYFSRSNLAEDFSNVCKPPENLPGA